MPDPSPNPLPTEFPFEHGSACPECGHASVTTVFDHCTACGHGAPGVEVADVNVNKRPGLRAGKPTGKKKKKP